jgi:DNA-binding PadR family transcriptional regulator
MSRPESQEEPPLVDKPLNATAASLLGFLHDGPMAGWDLVATARHRIGDFWSLTQSQVYRELATMAAAGLVEAGARGQRDKQPFRITASGRAAFAEWINREPGMETIRFPLLLTIHFGRYLAPERLAEFVATHRAAHAARLEGYERELADWRRAEPAAEAADSYRRATLIFGIEYERGVLAWFDELPTFGAPN